MIVAGIELEALDDEPGRIESRGLTVYPFLVQRGQGAVLRDDLHALIGETVNGREVVAVESFCVESQAGRVIGLAFAD